LGVSFVGADEPVEPEEIVLDLEKEMINMANEDENYAQPVDHDVPDAKTNEEPVLVDETEVPNEQNDFHSIPIIDLSLPLHGPNGYASQMREACRSSGFFYIINHGVDQELMAGVMEKSRDFFALGLNDKNACGVNNSDDGDATNSGYRGYFGIGMEDLENKDGTRDLVQEEGGKYNNSYVKGVVLKKGDQKEGFDCGLEFIPGYHENLKSHQAYIEFFGANSWPDESIHESIAGFHHTLVQYQKALLKLSDVLMMAFAVSLASNNNDAQGAVPEDFFITRSRNPMCTLRLLHYPPAPKLSSLQSNELLRSANGCGAHTDYGLFTILQQDVGGLQVRNKSHEWVDARPLPGSFVVNVGDMLSWWTEGEYASTVHRVISPALLDCGDECTDDSGKSKEIARHRYSIPFFFNPDHDAVVRPIRDGKSNADGSHDWKTAIEILRERYAGTFSSK
jgi:isopenicillin N synthase-like dioxygenase